MVSCITARLSGNPILAQEKTRSGVAFNGRLSFSAPVWFDIFDINEIL